MKFCFKKKVIAITGLGVAGMTIATTTSALTAYSNQIADNTQSNEIVVPIEDEIDGKVPNIPIGPSVPPMSGNVASDNVKEDITDWDEFRSGTMAASVVSRISEINLDFKRSQPNDYGLEQSYNEFVKNGDFSKFVTSAENLKTDLYLFIDSFWTKNNKDFDILSFSIDNFIVSGNNPNQIILGTSTVSFDINVEISAFKNVQLVVSTKTFNLEKGEKVNLKISVDNKTVKPAINELNNEFYLGWEISSATFEFKNQSFNRLLSPTEDSYSYAFQYIFDNLTNKKNYVELYRMYQSEILNMDVNTVKEKIVNYYDQQIEESMEYVDMGIKILEILKNNPNIRDLLSQVVPYVAKIVTKLNIFPSFIEPLLTEGFKDNQISFLSVFQKNKQAVMSYVNEYMPDLADLAAPVIEAIGPDITNEQIMELKSLLVYFGLDDQIVNIIVNDFLGSNGNPKSLYNIVFDNIKTFLSLIFQQNDNDVIDGILGIINLFITPNTKNELTPIFSVVFDGKTNKQTFISAIGKIINLTGVSSILDVLFVNNDLINLEAVQGILNSIYNFANGIFEKNDSYTNYKDSYKNIGFKSGFSINPTINKKDQTINFKYVTYLNFNKKVTLDLTPIKKMFTPENVWDLINSFQDISGYSWIMNKTWLYSGVMGFIPDSISVGGSPTSYTEINYEADNSLLFFDPVKSDYNYNLGFKFDYKTRIGFKDQTLVSSLTNPFNSNFNWRQIGPVLVWGDYYYSEFWRSVLSNVIIRDYVFTNRAHIEYSSKVVADVSTYDPNLYTTGFTVTPTDNSKKMNGKSIYDEIVLWPSFYTHEVVNTGNLYDVKYSNTKNYAEQLDALTPIIPKMLADKITSTNFSVSENANYLLYTNLSTKSYSDVLFNFGLPIHITIKYIVGKTDVKVNINFFQMNHQLYLPFMYYDTVSKKMVDSYSENFSQINNKVDSVGSWFWQGEFYR